MNIEVPFIPMKDLEQEANNLLADFARSNSAITTPPIPVEKILETHLGLSLSIDDLQGRMKMPDVLGATYVESREVVIDRRLDPVLEPDQEGRYHFTIGHEIAHWQLHRPYVTSNPNQGELFDDETPRPAIVCRLKMSKTPIEFQADFYSACLIMPREMVYAAWREKYGSLRPVYYEDHQFRPYAERPRSRRLTHVKLIMRDMDAPPGHYFFGKIAKQFAPLFRVSTEAMMIRLKELSLLQNRTEARPLGLFRGAF